MKDLNIKEMQDIDGGTVIPDPIDILIFFLWNSGSFWV